VNAATANRSVHRASSLFFDRAEILGITFRNLTQRNDSGTSDENSDTA
jgi:hypothetical protein